MSTAPIKIYGGLIALSLMLALSAKAQTAALTTEAPFLAANDAAMTKMMDGMAIKPTGDVDADFSAMMIPHHRGAIEMAEAELRYGRNEQLRRIAQEIIVDQQQEIAAMRLALGQPLPPSEPAPTQGKQPSVPASAPAPMQGSPTQSHNMPMDHHP